MLSEILEFRPVPGFKRLRVAQRGSLRCIAVDLEDGRRCLYSPVRGLAGAALNLAGSGKIAYLLAPNHYHYAGLAEHVAQFPQAQLCTSPAATARLHHVTGYRFDTLNELACSLGPDGSLLYPSGLKTGEIWIRVRERREVAWIVTDAFCGPKGTSGLVSKAPAILGTFPGFGIADRSTYVSWARRQLTEDRPSTLIPCHGALVVDRALPDKLDQLLTKMESLPRRRRSKS